MTDQELIHLCALSKLSLPEEERQSLSHDLDSLLALCDSLTKASDRGATEPERTLPSVTREDIPAPCQSRDTLLKEAPASRDGFFEIP